MCDLVLGAETGHLLVGKVRPVVEDDGVGEPEAAYLLLEKLDNLLPNDFGEWHCLDPFGEVVGAHQQEPAAGVVLGGAVQLRPAHIA